MYLDVKGEDKDAACSHMPGYRVSPEGVEVKGALAGKPSRGGRRCQPSGECETCRCERSLLRNVRTEEASRVPARDELSEMVFSHVEITPDWDLRWSLAMVG